jgi:NADPH oxidase
MVHHAHRAAAVFQTRYLASNVISLEMSKRFEYKPGQYVFLNCPYLSQNEWHPFTITSSPDQVGCFVSSVSMRYSYCLFVWLGFPVGAHPSGGRLDRRAGTASQPDQASLAHHEQGLPPVSCPVVVFFFFAFHDRMQAVGPDGTPLLRVDGPFGAASEDAFSYPVSILVGAGIGVTPFASILKSIKSVVAPPVCRSL